jgi:hypothetical protein
MHGGNKAGSALECLESAVVGFVPECAHKIFIADQLPLVIPKPAGHDDTLSLLSRIQNGH